MNKKVWLVLSVGLSFLSLEASVKKCDGSDLLFSLIAPSLVQEMNRQPDSDWLKMNWSDPRVGAVENRMSILERNQTQQDIRMQRQDDEIAGLRRIVAIQKTLLSARIENCRSSLGRMFTGKSDHLHKELQKVQGCIKELKNLVALQQVRVDKLFMLVKKKKDKNPFEYKAAAVLLNKQSRRKK